MAEYQMMKILFATLVLLCMGALVIQASPEECLRSANKYRALHMNTGPLQWDSTLAAKAKAYAQVLLNNALRYGSANLVHDPMNKRDPKMGENLWYEDNWKTGDDTYYCKKADKDWYAEIKDYSYATARSTGGQVGHFTQMVWVDTKRVGYGVAVGNSPSFDGNKIAFVVAKYQEPGNFNWIGQRLKDYTRNVQPLKGTGTPSSIKGGGSGNNGGSSNGKGSGESCEDNATRCLSWARRGECTANSVWMKKNCCKSCASASSKASKAGKEAKAGCKDNDSRCPGWAGRGECRRNSGWMMRNCKLSCGGCGGKKTGGDKPDVDVSCTDSKSKCSKYATKGYCSGKYEKWMGKYCCKSCKNKVGKDYTPPGGIGDPAGALDACLQSANKYRALHRNTPPLKWDATLAAKAKAYAQVLLNNALRNGYAMLKHDPMNKRKPKMGENLWYTDSWRTGDDTYYCKRADHDWYAEIKDYSYASTRTTGGGPIGHFTQMVWVATSRVGYGVAVADSRSNPGNRIAFVVAKYQRPGNVAWMGKRIRDFSKNVQPLK